MESTIKWETDIDAALSRAQNCTSSNGFGQDRSKTKRGFQFSYNPFLLFKQVSKSDFASFVKAWSFV
jgi:hypothetical protein